MQPKMLLRGTDWEPVCSRTPVTPALCGAEAERIAQVQGLPGIQNEFKANLGLHRQFKGSLGYIRRHYLNKRRKEQKKGGKGL